MSFASADSATRQSAGDAITPEDIIPPRATRPSKMLPPTPFTWATTFDPRPATGLLDLACPRNGRRRRPGQHCPGPAGPRTLPTVLCGFSMGQDRRRTSVLVMSTNSLVPSAGARKRRLGQTIARQLIFATYQYELFSRLVDSTDETLAAVAAKALKEVMYHLDHAAQWTLRPGDGTQESHRRMQEGPTEHGPYVEELFADDDLLRDLAERGIAVLPEPARVL